MNRSDGTVYLEAEGTRDALLQLLRWCAQGRPLKQVDTEEHSECAWVGYPALKRSVNVLIPSGNTLARP